MNIVILTEYDFSGNMYNLAQNINKLTKHKATAVKHRINLRLRYPTMIKANPKNMKKIKKLCLDADAIIFKEMPYLMKLYNLKPHEIKNKKIIVLFGGGGWIKKKTFRMRSFKNYGSLNPVWASTRLDFMKEKPDLTWLPASIRVEDLRKKYDYSKVDPPLLATSPSNNTDNVRHISHHFNHIIDHLEEKKVRFKHLLIKGMINDSCLKLKAHASVFFDRIAPIYGINSQEAGAFESAVVAGYNDNVDERLKEYGFNCPFINVKTPEQVANAVETLLIDEKHRKKKAQECYRFVSEVHDGRQCVNRLMTVLE